MVKEVVVEVDSIEDGDEVVVDEVEVGAGV